ncbi:EGF domain-specific O-linked N-acetylglucosamine transferase-like protein [Hapsidospora chrysogenum ATCC 11550]|uniref:EGF domain-specific O-linked N-acetylglucosamine transferase n=1 Tax=Hapsidospora chrysogenum (strain ATCC 11550 / CBS 779.69 / DSM 880 / IAM 14645 / JCM 23072 / IMI 49137) TaxID=857340 RepID=A0A086T8M8_HAPC1|nr:EGF domain-specific O-linked N-acetylglucosamine transferase-like protein [Hapsidospora chrysogenum ATCC 11550]
MRSIALPSLRLRYTVVLLFAVALALLVGFLARRGDDERPWRTDDHLQWYHDDTPIELPIEYQPQATEHSPIELPVEYLPHSNDEPSQEPDDDALELPSEYEGLPQESQDLYTGWDEPFELPEASEVPSTDSQTQAADTPFPELEDELGVDAQLDLPLDYKPQSTEDGWCQDRFGTSYLTNTRDWVASYCDTPTAGDLSCFWSQTVKTRKDALCYAGPAIYNVSTRMFHVGCRASNDITNPEDGTPLEIPHFPYELPIYWYETGPGLIVRTKLRTGQEDVGPTHQQTNRTTILVKRETDLNPWHSLLEIMSLSWTLDILQISVNPRIGEPYLHPESGNSTQVVLLDDYDDGPFIDLWRMFAKLPIRRIGDLGPDEPPSNVIIPLAGGGNPLWQGDWETLDCHDSALVRTFSGRVLDFYGVSTPNATQNVTVTYVRRTHTRKLIREEQHLAALQREIPHMSLEVVTFENLPFAQQLEVARRTDVLLGVHGAGLAHAFFLRPGSAVVEIQPLGFNHQGFRNLAQLRDLGYFRTHGNLQNGSVATDDRWQREAVQIEQTKLVDVVGVAVKSLYTRGGRNHDAT